MWRWLVLLVAYFHFVLISRKEKHAHYRGDDRVTVTTSHTNPGGRDGTPGRSGSSAMFMPISGQNGETGSVEMYVQDENGQTTGPFRTSYQLQIVDFEIVDDNKDGVL